MSTDYRVGEWVVRPQHGSIERGAEVVRIKPKSMAVLVCLAGAGNAVLTRDELFEGVWPGQVVSDATLTQCIVELRRAFGDSAQEAQVIRTIPKVGFCLIPEVETLPAGAEAGGEGGDIVSPAGKRHWPWLVAAVAVGIAVVAVGIRWHQQSPASGSAVPAVTDAGQASIAVLPFENISEETGNEYFADGLSEELRNLLAKIPQLQVAARTSSTSFRDRDVTISDIAEALGVTHVLEGSVRKAGDHIRISVQLIEASSGFDLWSQDFDRTLDDIFAVQDEIAGAVVAAWSTTLTGERPHQEKVNPDAYALLFQAHHFFRQVTPEGRAKAIEKLQAALKLDPNYSHALSFLATVYIYQSNNLERDFDEGYELARNTATQALAIDPRLSGPWGVLAWIQSYYDWDWPAAGRSIDRMLESEPIDETTDGTAANYYKMLGQFDRALELEKRALRLDPLSPYVRQSIAWTFLSMGRLDEAQSTLQSLLETHPEHRAAKQMQARIFLLRGNAKAALDLLQASPGDRDMDKCLLALALHGVDRTADAQAVVDSMSADPRGPGSYHRAFYFARVGQRDLAFENLEQAFGNRYRTLAYVLDEPMLYPLHDDPRWRNLLERIGLLEYWLKVPVEYGGPVQDLKSD